MIFYQLDHVVDEILKDSPSREQIWLKKYAGRDFPKTEAVYLWERITDHKWYVSERLRRDIGFRVAAIDYLENFYEPSAGLAGKSGHINGFRRFFGAFNSALRNYFISKSKILPS